MITDNTNNGIPSATKGRMQLTKPVQTGNTGLVHSTIKRPIESPTIQHGTIKRPVAAPQGMVDQSVVAGRTLERYNPLMPKPQTEQEVFENGIKPSQYGLGGVLSGATKTSPAVYSNPGFLNGTGFRGTEVEHNALIDALRSGSVSEKQLMDFLNGVADGTVSIPGYAPRPTSSVMTGEPGGTLMSSK